MESKWVSKDQDIKAKCNSLDVFRQYSFNFLHRIGS